MNISGNRTSYLFTPPMRGTEADAKGGKSFTTAAASDPASSAEAPRSTTRHASTAMLSELLSMNPEQPQERDGRLHRLHLSLRIQDSPFGPATAGRTSTELAAQIIRDVGSAGGVTAEDAKKALAPPFEKTPEAMNDLIGQYLTDHDKDRSGKLDQTELRDLIDRYARTGRGVATGSSATITSA